MGGGEEGRAIATGGGVQSTFATALFFFTVTYY